MSIILLNVKPLTIQIPFWKKKKKDEPIKESNQVRLQAWKESIKSERAYFVYGSKLYHFKKKNHIKKKSTK